MDLRPHGVIVRPHGDEPNRVKPSMPISLIACSLSLRCGPSTGSAAGVLACRSGLAELRTRHRSTIASARSPSRDATAYVCVCTTHVRAVCNHTLAPQTLRSATGRPPECLLQIYISHKWQFIFIRQPKSSSTAVLQEIKDNMCAVPGECTDHELLFTNQIDDLQWSSYFVYAPPPLHALQPLPAQRPCCLHARRVPAVRTSRLLQRLGTVLVRLPGHLRILLVLSSGVHSC